MKIGIGITTRNRRQDANFCISEILRLTIAEKVVIVDDNSDEPFYVDDKRVTILYKIHQDMKLTKNFTLEEFACKDGSATPTNLYPNLLRLANNLQVLRDELNTAIHVNSGYRSATYNAKIGGAKFSQHVYGKAADITAKGFTPLQVYEKILELIEEGKMQEGGLGIYDSWVHYDVREGKARWDERTTKRN